VGNEPQSKRLLLHIPRQPAGINEQPVHFDNPQQGTLGDDLAWRVHGSRRPRTFAARVERRQWSVSRRTVISDFEQYRHLAVLDLLVAADRTGTLEVATGGDYLVTPDVTVGVALPDGRPFLHAAISCKWTIRSDRVQNIRHEGVILTRHRRGRQPHIVTVTAEPLPSRLAAIARGTGEVDCVYHVAFDELVIATDLAEDPDQRRILDVLIAQERLMRFEELVATLLL
jgi:hypothetical protein